MLDIEIVSDTTDTRFTRGGSTRRVRVVRFFLGSYGPYTEEWAVEEFDDRKFQQRVSELRIQLQAMGRA